MPLPKFKHTVVTASGALSAVPARIHGVLVHMENASAMVKFYNAASATGTPVLEFDGLAGTSFEIDLTPFGGVEFDSKVYIDLAATGTRCNVFWE